MKEITQIYYVGEWNIYIDIYTYISKGNRFSGNLEIVLNLEKKKFLF